MVKSDNFMEKNNFYGLVRNLFISSFLVASLMLIPYNNAFANQKSNTRGKKNQSELNARLSRCQKYSDGGKGLLLEICIADLEKNAINNGYGITKELEFLKENVGELKEQRQERYNRAGYLFNLLRKFSKYKIF
jgi:hypothetical protein